MLHHKILWDSYQPYSTTNPVDGVVARNTRLLVTLFLQLPLESNSYIQFLVPSPSISTTLWVLLSCNNNPIASLESRKGDQHKLLRTREHYKQQERIEIVLFGLWLGVLKNHDTHTIIGRSTRHTSQSLVRCDPCCPALESLGTNVVRTLDLAPTLRSLGNSKACCDR